MNKNIVFIVLLLGTISAEHFNPNGKPYTLNVKVNILHEVNKEVSGEGINDEDMQTHLRPNIYLNMPISKYITINGGLTFVPQSEEYLRNSYLDNNLTSRVGIAEVFTFGLEAHLPLYKLFD